MTDKPIDNAAGTQDAGMPAPGCAQPGDLPSSDADRKRMPKDGGAQDARPAIDRNPDAFRTGGQPAPRPGAARAQRPPRAKQNAPGGGDGRRNSPYRTPASLTAMPRNVEAGIAARRNAKNYSGNSPAQEPKKRPDGRVARQPFNGEAHLYEVIQARLSRTQRLVEINTNGIRLAANTPVLIRFHRNMLMATTVGCRYRRVAEINALPFAVRIATDDDKRIDAENAQIEKHAYELASEFAIAQNLQMKVLSADLSHDHKNVTVNFASDVRVDFREMVAYLAGKLKMRVEMFQLGLRNGTGLICGLGSCGQLLCCGRFLGPFDPVAVRQIRAQGMASNPKRISGVCGRLYCCMSYEYCDYARDKRNLPKKGKRVLTRWGIGRVSDIDMIREDIVITYDNGETQRMTPRDYVPVTDEILADAESGKIEFPIEHARFYLNADPSAACETKSPLRMPGSLPHAPKPSPASKKIAASRAGAGIAARKRPTPEDSPKTAKNGQTEPRQKPADAQTGAEPRRAKPMRRAQRRDKKEKVGIVPNVPPDASPSGPMAPTPGPAQPPRSPAQAKPGLPGAAHERAPRKVKARQGLLEDAGNDAAREFGRPSRRRLPKNPNPAVPPSPTAPSPKGE